MVARPPYKKSGGAARRAQLLAGHANITVKLASLRSFQAVSGRKKPPAGTKNEGLSGNPAFRHLFNIRRVCCDRMPPLS